MILVNARANFEHAQVIRSDIGPESVEKFRDVQNGPISGKKLIISLALFFQPPLYFLETEKCICKTLHRQYTFHILDNIQTYFFYILINIKYSSYYRISKSKKNDLLLNVAL
jgi:hypothetical protein